MILLHALEAPYPIPGLGIRRGDTMYHLLSDRPGPAGTAELLAFVRATGGRDQWLQSPGTYREHFDIFGKWVDVARAMGAREATSREVAAILTHKRALSQAQGTVAVPNVINRQMRVVDDALQTTFGIDPRQTLELVGTRLAELTRIMVGGSTTGKRIALLIGPGNTGVGGLMAARHLLNAGAQVHVWVCVAPDRLSPLALATLATLGALGLAPRIGVVPEREALGTMELLIDALLGYGIEGAPYGMVAQAIPVANASGTTILALDLPSGLEANDEGPFDPCIQARATLALALPKRGVVLEAAREVVGDLWLADIGVPRRLFKRVGTRVGPLFARSSLVRLQRAPLAGADFATPLWQWHVADENDALP